MTPTQLVVTSVAHSSTRRSDRKALILFFVLAYGLSWSVWGSTLARDAGLIAWSVPAEPFGFLAVSVAAVVTAVAIGGRLGLRSLGSRLVLWRVAPQWYLAAIMLPVLPALAALGVHLALGGEHEMHAFVPLAAALPLLLSQLVTHLFTEEAGWRGVALPHLRAGLDALPAGVILGLLWAGWHIPMFFLAGTRQTYPFPGFVVLVASISVGMTWVWDHTRDSVLIAALFHAAMNTRWAVLHVLWGDPRLCWLCVAFTGLLAVAVAALQVRQARTASVPAATTTADEGIVAAP